MSTRTASWRAARLLTIAGVLIIGACARNNPGDNDAGSGPLEPAKIIFENQSLSQADVFAVIPGVEARRLGTVFAGSSDTLTLPADLAIRPDISIVARLLAGRSVSSGPIAIRPGDALRVTLPMDQRLLSVLPAND